MKRSEVKERLNKQRDIVFICKPTGLSFLAINYSGNGFINTLLSGMDIWATAYTGGKTGLYHNKFSYEKFELPIELYKTFKLNSIKRMFAKFGITLIIEEELEEE